MIEQNKKSIVTRYWIIAIALAFMGIAILLKGAYIMSAERAYWEKVADRFINTNVVLQPVRGNILSSDGKLMASSLPEFRIYLDFLAGGAQKDSILEEKMDSICEGLHRAVPNHGIEFYRNRLQEGRQKKSRCYAICNERLSYIQLQEIKKLPVFNLRPYKGGLVTKEFNQRKKPFGSLASSLLGDVFPDQSMGAKRGLEFAFDSVLKGTPGLSRRQKVKNKYLNIVEKEPINGADLITTIDVSMQDIAEKALVDKLKEIGGYKGVAILMEVATGDVKAMVNMQQYDDGNFYEGYNASVSDLMEPGSTFKTASMMVALENNVVTLKDSINTFGGVFMMHGKPMKDHNWHRGGYGWLTVPEILMKSSNVGVSRIIDERLTPEKYVNGLYKLGINADLKLPLKNTPRAIIRKPNKSNWWKTTLAWMSIGYETQIPPINTVCFYNAIANNGKMMKPRFVQKIVRNGETLQEFQPEVLIPSIASEHTLRDIKSILYRVVNDDGGLGKPAKSTQYTVSGKTGTAQISQGVGGYKTGRTSYLLSFCGFFPSENPKYTLLVAVQKTGLPASGGLMAGSCFHNIAERIYAKALSTELQAAKDTLPVRPKLPRKRKLKEGVTSYGIMPNLIGMSAKDACALLTARGLKIRISGVGRVIEQSKPYGSITRKGETIKIILATAKDAIIKKEEKI